MSLSRIGTERIEGPLVNSQTGTSYTLAATDWGKIVTQNNAGASSYTLPSTLGTSFWCWVLNIGVGACTLTPSSGTINGASSLALSSGSGALLNFDGTNWDGVSGGPYIITFAMSGKPPAGTRYLFHTFTQPATFPANLANSQGHVLTNPTAAASFTVEKITGGGSPVACGTISVSTSGVVTFTSSGGAAVSFTAGDSISIVTPTPQDSTLADVCFSLAGSR